MPEPIDVDSLPELLTVGECAEVLRVGLTRMRETLRDPAVETVAVVRVGRLVRVRRAWLEEIVRGTR